MCAWPGHLPRAEQPPGFHGPPDVLHRKAASSDVQHNSGLSSGWRCGSKSKTRALGRFGKAANEGICGIGRETVNLASASVGVLAPHLSSLELLRVPQLLQSHLPASQVKINNRQPFFAPAYHASRAKLFPRTGPKFYPCAPASAHRLDAQKGYDLLLEALVEILEAASIIQYSNKQCSVPLIMPLRPFVFGASSRKPNSRNKGALISRKILEDLEEGPQVLARTPSCRWSSWAPDAQTSWLSRAAADLRRGAQGCGLLGI